MNPEDLQKETLITSLFASIFNEMASHHVTGAAWVTHLLCSPWGFQCRDILDYIVKFDFFRLYTLLNCLTCVERALFRTYSNPSLRLL